MFFPSAFIFNKLFCFCCYKCSQPSSHTLNEWIKKRWKKWTRKMERVAIIMINYWGCSSDSRVTFFSCMSPFSFLTFFFFSCKKVHKSGKGGKPQIRRKKFTYTLIFIEAWIIEKTSTNCVAFSLLSFYHDKKTTEEGCIEFTFYTLSETK